MKIFLSVFVLSFLLSTTVLAKPPSAPTKAKFYNFSEQLIDGHIRRPSNLYLDARARVKFERLLKLKRSFMKELFDTSKLPVFK